MWKWPDLSCPLAGVHSARTHASPPPTFLRLPFFLEGRWSLQLKRPLSISFCCLSPIELYCASQVTSRNMQTRVRSMACLCSCFLILKFKNVNIQTFIHISNNCLKDYTCVCVCVHFGVHLQCMAFQDSFIAYRHLCVGKMFTIFCSNPLENACAVFFLKCFLWSVKSSKLQVTSCCHDIQIFSFGYAVGALF